MANPILAVRDYLKSSIAELQKVTWPTKEMTIRFSVLVMAVSLAFAGFFAALDFGLRKAVNAVFVSDAPQAVQPELPDVQPILEDGEGNPVDVNIEGNPSQEFQVGDVEAETDTSGELTLPPLE